MRPCQHCGHAVGNAEKSCAACGAELTVTVRPRVEPAETQSEGALLPIDLQEQLVQRMLIAAAVVCNLLVAGGLWYASGSLLVGTVGLMVFLVVQGTVFRMFSM